jgi:hypothetical protein
VPIVCYIDSSSILYFKDLVYYYYWYSIDFELVYNYYLYADLITLLVREQLLSILSIRWLLSIAFYKVVTIYAIYTFHKVVTIYLYYLYFSQGSYYLSIRSILFIR